MLLKKIGSIFKKIIKTFEIKKIFADDTLYDDTASPYLITYLKDFFKAYKTINKHNCWEYEISRYNFKNLDSESARIYLIEQYNIYFYQLDPKDPFIIDERDKIFIKLIKKSDLELNSLPNLSSHPSTNKIDIPTRWEKIQNLLTNNVIFKFLNNIWYAISSDAYIVRLIFFGCCLVALPISPLCLTVIAIIFIPVYLLAPYLFRIRKKDKNSKQDDLASQKEENKLLNRARQYVFEKIQHQQYLAALHNIIIPKDINIENSLPTQTITKRLFYEEKINACFSSMPLEKSPIYLYLNEVYPKTQFIASLITNLTQIALYNYAIIWVISIVASALNATVFALLISSPPIFATIFLIFACIFLISHLIKYRARESTYQRRLINILKQACEIIVIDKNGIQKKLILDKWQVFEYLKKEIEGLEQELEQRLQQDTLSSEIKDTVFEFYQLSPPQGKLSKRMLYRIPPFSFGIFYGFGVEQQAVLGKNIIFSIFALPLMLIIAIANVIIYHLIRSQRKKLAFLEDFDNQIYSLENKREKILQVFEFIENSKKQKLATEDLTDFDPVKHPQPNRRVRTHEKFFQPMTPSLHQDLTPQVIQLVL